MTTKTKKTCLGVIGALLLVLSGFATQSEAGINLPAIRFPAPPNVVVIPGTYVYMVPDIDVDVLFYQGYWWRPYEGHWYRSRDYQGHYTESRSIPGGLRALPQDYRHRITPGHERIPQGDVQRNWKQWEKEKHWDGQGKQGRGKSGEHGQGRGRQNDQDRGDRGGDRERGGR